MNSFGWIISLALRDARRNLRPLSLVAVSIVVGVAALVSIRSFKENVTRAVEENARPLLGADLCITSRQPFSTEADNLLQDIPGESSRELSFASMAFFPKQQKSRLVQVNAISGSYPYYGRLETNPSDADNEFRAGGAVVVDRSLLLQFGASVGDSVRLGEKFFRVAGTLTQVPGVIDVRNAVAPRIYMSLQDLPGTGLMTLGSRVRYKQYYKLPDSVRAEMVVKGLKERLLSLHLTSDTVEERKAWMNKTLDSVYQLLDLIGFVSFILGGIGVGGAASVYVTRRTQSVAILRCLGTTSSAVVGVFLAQMVIAGSVSTLIGIVLGISVQLFLPALVKAFLPVEVPIFISWSAISLSAVLSVVMLVVFTLESLIAVGHVSPLAVLRTWGHDRRIGRTRWLVRALVCASATLLAMLHSGSPRNGMFFSGAVFLSWGILLIFARFLSRAASGVATHWRSFIFRQAVANLHRPHNQTTLLIASIGIVTFVMSLVLISQQAVLGKTKELRSDQANMVLFDVQGDQLADVVRMVTSSGVTPIETVPIVTMRLQSVKGRTVKELRGDPNVMIEEWTLTREYRSTYRDTLANTETLLEGSLEPYTDERGLIPVSLEKRIAERLSVGLGDELEFELQGILLRTRVASIREVDWQRVQPNFFVVFPSKVLEEAPQFHVIVAKARTAQASAKLQLESVTQFPNVSIIDFSLVLKTVDTVLAQLTSVLAFMAMFSAFAAGIVLFVAVVSARNQRSTENALLKTLGASRRTVVLVTLCEYGLLGSLAALGGGVLSFGCGALLAKYVFRTSVVWGISPTLIVFCLTVGMTLLIGWLGSRGLYRRSALEILRLDIS